MRQRLKRLHCPIHCTFIVRKCFSLWSPTDTTWRPQYRIDSQRWIEKAPSFPRYRKSPPFHSSVRRLAVSITSGLLVILEELTKFLLNNSLFLGKRLCDWKAQFYASQFRL